MAWLQFDKQLLIWQRPFTEISWATHLLPFYEQRFGDRLLPSLYIYAACVAFAPGRLWVQSS